MAMKSSSVMLVVLALVALMATSSKAQLCPPGLNINLGVVTGVVSCSVNASTSAPPFPNATVLLRCGPLTLGSTVTNSSGQFSLSITTPILQGLVLSLFSGGCNVVVTTPLVACNATLPATGTLVAPVVSTGLGLIGSLLALFFTILEFVFTQ